MGKKAKGSKSARKRVDLSTLPDPPLPVEEDIGSRRLLPQPHNPTTDFKIFGTDGYDDGGVGDLKLVIDMEDHMLRRKRGEMNYFMAVQTRVLPRATWGPYTELNRHDQKMRLASMLFNTDNEDNNPGEVYTEPTAELPDEEKSQLMDRLREAKECLRLSLVLHEPSCASVSLGELSKRYLSIGKEYAEDALRCAQKACDIAGDSFYDNDEIAVEVQQFPVINTKYEKNATTPCLANPVCLKYQSVRVATLCVRAGLMNKGNAYSALGRTQEARDTYQQILPYLDPEPRSCRVDWERASVHLNMGNTYATESNYEKALEHYDIAEKLGRDHKDLEGGNNLDGLAIVVSSMRFKSFCLKKAGREAEGKTMLKQVLEMQPRLDKMRAERRELMDKLSNEHEAKSDQEMADSNDPAPLVAEA